MNAVCKKLALFAAGALTTSAFAVGANFIVSGYPVDDPCAAEASAEAAVVGCGGASGAAASEMPVAFGDMFQLACPISTKFRSRIGLMLIIR